MKLHRVISILRSADPSAVISPAFSAAHSYRANYDRIAFEPCAESTVGEMLELAESCIGGVFSGYHGGEYRMGTDTECVVAPFGKATGSQDEEQLLNVMDAVLVASTISRSVGAHKKLCSLLAESRDVIKNAKLNDTHIQQLLDSIDQALKNSAAGPTE